MCDGAIGTAIAAFLGKILEKGGFDELVQVYTFWGLETLRWHQVET